MKYYRSSPTSFIVHWDTPRTTPLGYTIFYNITGDCNITCDADNVTVNASNDSYNLTVMSECNYSVSIMALSRHLPSAVVGSLIPESGVYYYDTASIVCMVPINKGGYNLTLLLA